MSTLSGNNIVELSKIWAEHELALLKRLDYVGDWQRLPVNEFCSNINELAPHSRKQLTELKNRFKLLHGHWIFIEALRIVVPLDPDEMQGAQKLKVEREICFVAEQVGETLASGHYKKFFGFTPELLSQSIGMLHQVCFSSQRNR